MKKIKKVLKIAAVVVVVLIVALWVFLTFFLDSTVRAAVEKVLPQITGTTVQCESVRLSIFSGRGTVKGLVIGNPPGFKTQHAFYVGTATVELDLWSLLTNRIIIEEIYVDAPEIIYEFGITGGSNIGKIQENVDKFAGPKEEKPGRKIQINHLLVKNGKVGVASKDLQGRGVVVPLPEIERRDIGKESGGASVGAVTKQVFGTLTDAIGRAADAAQKGIGVIGDTLKGLGGAGAKGVSDAVDKVKGIFK